MTVQSRRSLTVGFALLVAAIAVVAVFVFQKQNASSRDSASSTGFVSQSTATPGAAGDKAAAVKALRRDATASDTPLFATQELAGASRRVAISASGVSSRSVFVGKNEEGQVCLILQGKDIGGGGGCNPARDPFAGETVWLSSNHVGGGALPDELTIFGVAREGVSQVEVSVGETTLTPAVSADGGFVVVLPGAKVGRGTVNVTVSAFGSSKADALGTTSTQLHLGD